jgi:predicted ATPase
VLARLGSAFGLRGLFSSESNTPSHALDEIDDRLASQAQLRPAPRGVYMWGDVGCGKTMMMDLFYDSAPVHSKLRVHFHEFMRDFHSQVHQVSQQLGTRSMSESSNKDPVPRVAERIARSARLLCFDEFQVRLSAAH